MNGEACILCCENIEAEVRKALDSPDLQEIQLIVFDRHNADLKRKRLTEPEAFNKSGEKCRLLLVLGCGCMYKAVIPQADGVESIFLGSGPDLFLPPELVEHELSRGSYMVTPGWLREWREHLQEAGGSLETMIKETVKEIVLLDTGTVPDIDGEFESFADHIGLPYSKLPVGVHNLRLLVQSKLCDWRCQMNKTVLNDAENAKRRAADYAMVFDLMGEVTGLGDEADLIENVLRIYELLFSPQKISYVSLDNEREPDLKGESIPDNYIRYMREEESGCILHTNGNGFLQLVSYKEERMGAIIVEGLNFPRFIHEYINTSNFISVILGLAIFNARIYGKLNNTIDELESEVMVRVSAEGKLATANHKLNLLGKITRHDTLNQITVIKGYLDLMADSIEEERYKKYMGRMDTAVNCMIELTEFAREYEKIGMDGSEWIHIDEVLSGLDTDGLTLENSCPGLMVYADKLLDKVFYNLLDNTMRHSGDASEVVISCEKSDNGLMLRWEDNGQGVPDEEKERIFDRGYGKNTGYGLFIMREILNITGISIIEDGVPGQGARFSIRIPEGHYKILVDKAD